MNRRRVLKQMLFVSAGTVIIPSCMQNPTGEMEQLAAAADALIPGVSAMGAPAFITRMMNDCYSEADRKKFTEGMKNNDEFFQKTLKKLTIDFYTNSKYYLTNIEKYELVPGRFHGCVAI